MNRDIFPYLEPPVQNICIRDSLTEAKRCCYLTKNSTKSLTCLTELNIFFVFFPQTNV